MKRNITFSLPSSLILILWTCCFNATVFAQTPTTTVTPTIVTPTTAATPQAAATSAATPTTLSSPVWPNFETAFQAGVSNYQQKKYDDARLAFGRAVELQPENVNALTNLALAQFQLGNKGFAVALLRKASGLDPHFSTTQEALKFILPQLEVQEIPHEIQTWETIRTHFLVPFSLTSFLAMTALSLFAAGWLTLKYFGQRRRALEEETAMPPAPLVAVFCALVFIAMTTLTAMKLVDHQIPRGTVIADKVPVYSAPDEKSVELFDLYGGLEVILNHQEGSWVQVTYPGGLTGWIPKSSVLPTSGRKLW
jgi:tetratricopeptide (TPR) repeat protein